MESGADFRAPHVGHRIFLNLFVCLLRARCFDNYSCTLKYTLN